MGDDDPHGGETADHGDDAALAEAVPKQSAAKEMMASAVSALVRPRPRALPSRIVKVVGVVGPSGSPSRRRPAWARATVSRLA